jgi:hypothetical protein
VLDSYVVSTTLNVHPRDVRRAATQWHQSLPACATGGSVRFTRRFWLATKPDEASVDPLEYYRVRGIVWLFGRPIRVELAFSIWSDTVSELTLRPATLTWPVCTEHYEIRAVRLLEDVASSVTSMRRPVLDVRSGLTPHLVAGVPRFVL